MNAHQLVNQTTGKTEWYTPFPYVEAARRAMGGIDLDPASCAKANETVKATVYFTKDDDGLKQEWAGRVWMNHPSEKGKNKLWIAKLVESYESGLVVEACCITFAVMSERWFRPLLTCPQCHPWGRVQYIGPDGKIVSGVTKGSVITYIGKRVERFAVEFGKLGQVKVPYVAPKKRWWR